MQREMSVFILGFNSGRIGLQQANNHTRRLLVPAYHMKWMTAVAVCAFGGVCIRIQERPDPFSRRRFIADCIELFRRTLEIFHYIIERRRS
jgi:hypothetical protein